MCLAVVFESNEHDLYSVQCTILSLENAALKSLEKLMQNKFVIVKRKITRHRVQQYEYM